MSGLIAYTSSEDEDDLRPEKPVKMAKHEATILVATRPDEASATRSSSDIPAHSGAEGLISELPPSLNTSGPSLGPAAGPTSNDIAEASSPQQATSVPFSPYTFERQRVQEFTMPTVPNFSIPDSPPRPANNSEDAARLAATTKKFERFLELKKQGVHFNERLQLSSSLRNPSLLPKLMEFGGIDIAGSYQSTLPPELGVPSIWPEECYVENLVRRNEKGEKKRLAEREKIDFVSATNEASKADAVRGPEPDRVPGKRETKFGR